MNKENLHELINRYENNYHLVTTAPTEEKFKWGAVRGFRDVWFSDNAQAMPFPELFSAAAKESCIPALVRFAELKEKRIDGLIAHATYPISTGKLEGFNNKIKVAKRLAYGDRDNHFFFTLVRFLSVPLPNFP